MTPKELTDKLSKWWWSPLPPETYLIPHPTTGAMVGIGKIASKSYAAFNVTYAHLNGKLSTVEHHAVAIRLFTSITPAMDVYVEGAELGSWVTLLSKGQFATWALGKEMPVGVRGFLPLAAKSL